MPPVFHFFFGQVVLGFAAAAVFVALLLAMDVGGLRGLVARSPDGMLAVFLFFVLNGLVFGGARAAMAVFRLAEIGSSRGPSGRRVEARTRSPRLRRRPGGPQRPTGTTVP